MEFTVKSYDAPKDILFLLDDYTAITVNVDDANIVAGADGKKIIPAGTIIGGVLDDPTAAAVPADGVEVAAEGLLLHDVDVTAGDALGTMVIRGVIDAAKLPEAPTLAQIAQLKQITFIGAGADDDVAFLMSGDFTVVNISVSNTGVEADAASKKIRKAGAVLGGALADPTTGAVAASTAATDNSNNPTPAEGILLYDVDVTDGTKPGVLLVRGVVDASKLPAAVNAYQRGTMPGITFVGTYSA